MKTRMVVGVLRRFQVLMVWARGSIFVKVGTFLPMVFGLGWEWVRKFASGKIFGVGISL
jgi:hypothetical protein